MESHIKMEPSNTMLLEGGEYSPMSAISSDSSLTLETPGRSRKNKEDKLCGVCGDRALGYNFDAISCESCKAFFRRNAPKGLDYFKCPYDEKCKMDISNRRFCKRCRLKKCFEIGMRKEYILTDDEKARKKQKIEENRMANRVPDKMSFSASPSSNISSTPRMPTREVDPQVVKLGSGGEVTSQTKAMTAEDTEQIEELLMAYKASLEITHEKKTHTPDGVSSMSDLVNIAEISVRRVIDMAKKVQSFKALPQADQISLLKGGSIELLILRSVITFDTEKQHFLDPCDQEDTAAMNTEQLRMAENGTGLFDDHMKFVKSLAIDLHADQTTLILLLVISLFSPDRPNVVNKELVSAEQERYSLLLQKYLETRYPVGTAHTLYPKLLMKLTDIRNLNEEHSQVLLKVNPEGIQPLMQEVLDLRN
ncbi:hypothetical protein NP493_1030g00015 [Ridgeia piscesae]|uniref:Nuclear hormone receptor HR96 n=1 Tax=Ridgeia piscesae TaxID=27915 RepID=A0AAD9KHM0_RIDPI|nr:hypothetical protein NP493_1030g00015 [Ridgeia piscesae]